MTTTKLRATSMNNNPLLIFENLDTTPRRQLFVLLGTPWRVTP